MLADAAVDPEMLVLAFRVYAEALGLTDTRTISRDLFLAHFEADPKVVGPKTVASSAAAVLANPGIPPALPG